MYQQRLTFIWLVFFTVIIVLNLIPSVNNFEGELIANNFSFTSVESTKRQKFLADTPFKSITISGLSEEIFTGDFKSNSDPAINQVKELKIEKLKQAHNQPKITIKNLDPDRKNNPVLSQIEIYKNTRISDLNYDASRNLISFCLQENRSSDDQCFLNLDSAKPRDKIAKLDIYLDAEIFDVTLEGYEITNPKLINNASSSNREFNWIPESGYRERSYEITHPMQITIEIPKPQIKSKNTDTDDINPLIQKSILIKEANFAYKQDAEDQFLTSSIIQGKIRMAEQDIKIESSQFFKTEGGEGVQGIYNIKTDLQGFKFLIAGNASSILSGLNYQSPIYNTRANFWANFLSKEVIIAITAFCAGMISNLLMGLFNKIT